MIDIKKRQTLKAITAVAGATVAASIPGVSGSSQSSDAVSGIGSSRARQVWPPIAVKAPIELTTRILGTDSNTEVVLTNTSHRPVTMTHITPAKLSTPAGTCDLNKVLEAGPRYLAAGESVVVSLKRHDDNGKAETLQQLLRSGLSISTDDNQFSTISYALVA